MDTNPIEYMRKNRHKVEDLLPATGATREEINEALSKIRVSYFMPLLCVLVLTSLLVLVQHVYFRIDLNKLSAIAYNLGFAIYFGIWAQAYVDQRKKDADLARQLCSECDAPELINQVSQLARLPDTHKWLQRIINNSKRDYLCWYEVFLALDIKGPSEQEQQQRLTAKQTLLDAVKK